jgi:hypothetical protein
LNPGQQQQAMFQQQQAMCKPPISDSVACT